MRRVAIVVMLGLPFVPIAVESQETRKIYRIGFLSPPIGC